MDLLNFKEIHQANVGDGHQDEFELFARDFFETLGFRIEEGPDRGADGGRDLIVIEKRAGLLSDTMVKWLVSCKHYAHSGNAVLENDEEDIPGRLSQFNCQGFIGFYSTLPSSGLSRKINSYKDRFETCVFDYKKIEKTLLDYSEMEGIIKRYFPISYNKDIKKIGPAQIYSKYYPLKCEVCGQDLIQKGVVDTYQGLIGWALDLDYYDENNDGDKIIKVYCACKGNCDRIIESRLSGHAVTQWEDISDLSIPYNFLKWVVGIMNGIRKGHVIYSDEAYKQIIYIILCIAQVAMRQPSVNEIQRTKELLELPNGI